MQLRLKRVVLMPNFHNAIIANDFSGAGMNLHAVGAQHCSLVST
ncbi:hypothetical protein [Desmonostoc muscorum]|nr:hypothetical protein [Desmonostoc muscorum]